MTKSSDTSDSSALGGSSIKLRLKNFKSFGDSGPIRISPITLLFGENSAGKSSIIQAYMALAFSDKKGLAFETEAFSMRSFDQVAKDGAKTFAFTTEVNGPSLGGLKIPGTVKEEMLFTAAADRTNIVLQSIKYSTILDFDSETEDKSSASKDILIGVIQPSKDGSYYRWAKITDDLEFWEALYQPMRDQCEPLKSLLADEWFEAESFKDEILSRAQKRPPSGLLFGRYSTGIAARYMRMAIAMAEGADVKTFRQLYKSELLARRFDPDFRDRESFDDDFYAPHYYKPEEEEPFKIPYGMAMDYASISSLPEQFQSRLTESVATHYVSAYRQRVPDLVQRQLGDSVADDGWFYDAGLRDFLAKTMLLLSLPYAVEVDDLGHTDYFKIWLLDKNRGIRRHPSDVGFGVGQIIQIMTRLYLDSFVEPENDKDKKKVLQIVEEPEAHLHPKLQKALAKVLSPAYVENCSFLIETHSEPLVMGYLEEVREGRLHHEDLSIVYVEQTEKGSVATSFQIDESGEFVGGWPEQLFPIVD